MLWNNEEGHTENAISAIFLSQTLSSGFSIAAQY